MVRVPYVSRDELDTEGQAIYDRIRQDCNAPEVGLQFRALMPQTLLSTQGVVDLALTCAVCLAQIVLQPDMEAGRVSTL